MGFMSIGILTGLFAMGIVFVTNTITAILIGILAYKLRMSPFWWVIATLVMSWWVFIPFTVVVLKIRNQTCHFCGGSTQNNTGACPNCGSLVKRTDDAKIVKKILLGLFIAFVVFEVAVLIFSYI